MHEVSYDWLRLVETALMKIEQLPPLEENFPFPWEEAQEAVKTALEVPELALSSSKTAWKSHAELNQALGEKPFVVAIEIAPIEGNLFFAMSQHDASYLISQTLVMGEYKENFSNAKLKEGFYHFLLLKVLQAIDQMKIFKEATLYLTPAHSIPHEDGFCVEIDASFPEKTIRGRVICPPSFLAAFKAYVPMQKGTLLSSDIAKDTQVSLRCRVGQTEMPQEEWDQIQVGDFVMLDRCSFDPVEGKGSITLLLGDTPLLMARMKHEGMKVLDFAFYQEEEPSSFHISAEVGLVKISLQKLLHLQPGMMLDLVMSPELGVDLTVEGKKVGKGELLKLGETVGIRILDVAR